MAQCAESNKNNINKSYDIRISLALMASFVILTIQYFILIYFDLLGTSSASKVQMVSKALVGIAYVIALPIVFKRSKKKILLIYFIGIFIFVTNYMVFPDNRSYLIELLFPFFFMSLPAFVYSLSIYNLDVFKRIMKKISVIVVIVGAILGVLIISGRVSAGEYSMALSYYMLLPAVMFLDELINRFSFKAILISIISLLVILALGSRGAILCIIIFIVLRMTRLEKFTLKRITYYTIIFGAIALVYINLERIFESTYYMLLNFGINSRSLMLFLREDEVHLSGRDALYNTAINSISENPILGSGIAGDRSINGGGYVHNLFLEILIDFGVIAGTFVLFLILFILVRALLQTDKGNYKILSIWISLGLVPLMVSSSYITDMEFWVFIGILFNLGILKRREMLE